MRVSISEALKLGWIDKSSVPAGSTPKQTRKKKSAGARANEDNAPAPRLRRALAHIPGMKVEYIGAVPGRRFALDIAFPEQKLCVEVDGWEWHGKHLGDFQRDRERQNLLTLEGWRILRFTASDIRKTPEDCVRQVEKALAATGTLVHPGP